MRRGERLPLRARAALEDLDHLRVRLAPGALELALDQVLAPHPAAERLPELRLERPQRDPAVRALVRPVADQRARERQLAAARHGAVREVAGGHHRQPRQRAVGHRDVDELAGARARRGPRAAPVALAQRGHDPERRHQRAPAHVGDLARRLHGLPAALAREPQQAHQSQVVHVVPREVPLGRVLAVARDRAVDDPRVLLAHALVAHAEALQHARAEGLEQHVVIAHQPQQHLPSALLLEVHADRALVAVQRQEQRRARALVHALVVGGRPADVVAHARVLDLQHLRAEVRQQKRAEPARQKPREVEHADALERQAHPDLTAIPPRADPTTARGRPQKECSREQRSCAAHLLARADG